MDDLQFWPSEGFNLESTVLHSTFYGFSAKGQPKEPFSLLDRTLSNFFFSDSESIVNLFFSLINNVCV